MVKIRKTLIIILIFLTLILNFVLNANSQIIYGKYGNHLDDDLFDKKINFFLKIGHYPSLSTCIIKNDTIIWYKGYRYSNFDKLEEPCIDTIYQTGSISKTFTAVAILQLYEKGLVDLDDDINKYIDFNLRNPNFPDTPITIRMLLSHRASFQPVCLKQDIFLLILSISDYPKCPYPLIKEVFTPDGSLYNKNAWIKDIKPGTASYYTNYDFIVLEHLIEVLTNQTFEKYCDENIIQPLEMYNTSFFWQDFSNDKIAILYEYFLGNFFQIPAIDYISGIGGLKTNIEDLSHYLIAHMNNGIWKDVRILSENTSKFMHEVVEYNSIKGYNLGMGWQEIYIKRLNISLGGHEGIVPGCHAYMFMNNSKDIGVILFFNKNPIRPIENIISSLIFYEIIDKALKI